MFSVVVRPLEMELLGSSARFGRIVVHGGCFDGTLTLEFQKGCVAGTASVTAASRLLPGLGNSLGGLSFLGRRASLRGRKSPSWCMAGRARSF